MELVTNNIAMKKSILILIAHYLPGYKAGGPITSILSLTQSLKNNYRFKIITFDRDLGEKKTYKDIVPNHWRNDEKGLEIYYLKKNIFSLLNLLKLIKNTKHEILYVNSLFSPIFSIGLVFFYKFGIINITKFILAPRGELFENALKFKSLKKSIFLKIASNLNLYKNVLWHATSVLEMETIQRVFKIEDKKIRIAAVIPNLISSSLINEQIFPTTFNALKIVFLSRISKDKNIEYIFEILMAVQIPIVLHIYGPIEDDYIWNKCKDLIKLLPKNVEVEYKGFVERNRVRSIIINYDLFFLPSHSENFGHVIAESLSVGTPVLISDKTPWQNLSELGFGWDLGLSENAKYIEAIMEIYNLSSYEKTKKRKQIKEKYMQSFSSSNVIEDNIKLFIA